MARKLLFFSFLLSNLSFPMDFNLLIFFFTLFTIFKAFCADLRSLFGIVFLNSYMLNAHNQQAFLKELIVEFFQWKLQSVLTKSINEYFEVIQIKRNIIQTLVYFIKTTNTYNICIYLYIFLQFVAFGAIH